MNLLILDIISWNPRIIGKSPPKPAITVKSEAVGDLQGQTFPIRIAGSGLYDGTVMATALPHDRPNFEADTGMYTIMLNTLWSSYPHQLGMVALDQIGGADALDSSDTIEPFTYTQPVNTFAIIAACIVGVGLIYTIDRAIESQM